MFFHDIQPTWTEEMSQGLFVEDDKEVDEAEIDDEYEGAPAGPVRAVDRKTKQQRRKEKEKEEEASVKCHVLDDLRRITHLAVQHFLFFSRYMS